MIRCRNITGRRVVQHSCFIECSKWQSQQGGPVDRLRQQIRAGPSFPHVLVAGGCTFAAPVLPPRNAASYDHEPMQECSAICDLDDVFIVSISRLPLSSM